MANRLETHVWFDGDRWRIYSERAADIRRFSSWFGTPSSYSRDDTCARWDDVPADALRVRRKAKRGSRIVTPASVQALNAHRTTRKASEG